MGLPGSGILSAASGQPFAVPTPPYADGSWEMYQDFVGGVQFWGYALATGSGDGGVRMWDSKLTCRFAFEGPVADPRTCSAYWTST